jgi:hypothetical protein
VRYIEPSVEGPWYFQFETLAEEINSPPLDKPEEGFKGLEIQTFKLVPVGAGAN